MAFMIRQAKEEDFKQIKELQELSHFTNVKDSDKEKEGFVSIETDFSMLKRLHEKNSILVGVKDSEIVGYEIPLDLENARKIFLLEPFIKRILMLKYKGKRLSEYKIIIEGQICIKKGHKGEGIAERLHEEFVRFLKPKYDLIITEISNQNPRSLYVHTKKLGLSILEQYSADGRDWYILIQDMRVS
jgi:hypothetical protein